MIRSVLKSLLKPEAYPEDTKGVELVQTHVSYIFLTDAFAYKIKKAVDFGFLNFSTIDRRRFYCNEEVRLNRRLCPDVYLGVVELRETTNGAAFTDTGTVIDYAVKMKRLPADRMLDKLVDRGEIDASTIRNIASLIAEFHRSAPSSACQSEHGRLDRIMFNWQENFEQMIPFENKTLPSFDRELIRSWVQKFSMEHGELFEKRVHEGYIRECDGDIHLENICLDNDAIHIFDCIEFNDRFRCCDTAADIAFLLMDLDFHGRCDLAEDAINEYVAVSGDQGAQALIYFYKIYRAYVRGKVESFRLNDSGIAAEEQSLAAQRAMRYFRLVRGYIERGTIPQTLFITCGLMGSGKSTLASQLSFELGVPLFSSDVIRKQLAGFPADQPVHNAYNEGLYSPQSHESTYAELFRQSEKQLVKGTSVIIDACFPSRLQRTRFVALAQQKGINCVILYLDGSEADIRRRLLERENKGPSVSDGRVELFAQQAAAFEPPDETEGHLIHLGKFDLSVPAINEIYARMAL
jgi:aminoglycoside phosphotransferase family enzyme/predicted kinase